LLNNSTNRWRRSSSISAPLELGVVLTNQNGTVLALSGHQAGLIVAADLNGLVISLRYDICMAG
jgi:hypothetical protein